MEIVKFYQEGRGEFDKMGNMGGINLDNGFGDIAAPPLDDAHDLKGFNNPVSFPSEFPLLPTKWNLNSSCQFIPIPAGSSTSPTEQETIHQFNASPSPESSPVGATL